MTKNQLEYWKLRWQQYYDMLKLQHEKDKLQLDWAKLRESRRAARAQESIKWGELNLATQKFYVQTVLDNHKAFQEYIKIQQSGIKLKQSQESIEQKWAEISQQAEKLLMSKVTMRADLAQQLASWKSNNTREWIKTTVDSCGLVGKILGEKEVASIIGAATAEVGNQEMNEFYRTLENDYPEFGPFIPKQTHLGTEPKVDEPNMLSSKAQEAQDYVDRKRKEAESGGHVIGFTNTEPTSNPSDASEHTGVSVGPVGSTQKSVETRTPGGTRVIYSPGTHDGPGFVGK